MAGDRSDVFSNGAGAVSGGWVVGSVVPLLSVRVAFGRLCVAGRFKVLLRLVRLD